MCLGGERGAQMRGRAARAPRTLVQTSVRGFVDVVGVCVREKNDDSSL